MNLEEAKANIGAEVELDESTKPYTWHERLEYTAIHSDDNLKDFTKWSKIFVFHKWHCDNDKDVVITKSKDDYDYGVNCYVIDPKHLKLKPQNYKIHVRTEEESREAQDLFFELGYKWTGYGKVHTNINSQFLYALESGRLRFDREELPFQVHTGKQITLQDLREMVAKKGIKSVGVDLASGEDKKVKGEFQNFESSKEMTWEDALRAVADGKEVEILDIHGEWGDIRGCSIDYLLSGEFDFRLAPQRIKLNGEFTKQELLRKIGEME